MIRITANGMLLKGIGVTSNAAMVMAWTGSVLLGERDDELTGPHRRPDLLEQAGHVLRLHHQREGVGALGRVEVGDDGDGVLLLELAGALGALLADQQLGDRTSGADQPGQQGLAHDPGTEDRR